MTTEPKPKKLGYTPRVEIHVTDDIVATATAGDSAHCMIADAIAAQIPDARSVSVDLQTIRWSNRKKGERYVYLTPPVAQDALVRFDQGQPVHPFSIRLARGQVTRIKAANKAQADHRAERKATIAAKEAAGEPLTSTERRAKAQLNTPDRPTNQGATEMANEQGTPVRRGGTPPPVAVLSNSKGRARVYGMKALRRADGDPLTIGLQVIE